MAEQMCTICHKLICCYVKHLPSFYELFFLAFTLLFYWIHFRLFIQHVHAFSSFTSWLLLFKLIANKRASTVYTRQAASSWPRTCLSPVYSISSSESQFQSLPLNRTHAMQKFNLNLNQNYLYRSAFFFQSTIET